MCYGAFPGLKGREKRNGRDRGRWRKKLPRIYEGDSGQVGGVRWEFQKWMSSDLQVLIAEWELYREKRYDWVQICGESIPGKREDADERVGTVKGTESWI